MASASPSFVCTKGKTNYALLCRLLVSVGSQVLKDTFDQIHPPADLHDVLAHPPAHPALQSLKKKRILNPTQWGKLYPIISSSVSSTSFDITLLITLLRNICDLRPPLTGWDNLPSVDDTSLEANIARLRFYRNKVYGHASRGAVDDPTFERYWQDISDALVGLGAGASYLNAINRLKTERMDSDIEEHFQELLKAWKKDDDDIGDRLDEMEAMQKKWKGDKDSTNRITGDIEAYQEAAKKSRDGTKRKHEEMEGVEAEGKKKRLPHSEDRPPRLSIKLPKLSDLPNTSKQWSDAELPIDILLLTVEDCEFLSCFAYLDNSFKSYRKEIGPVYFGAMGKGDQGKLKVAIIKCSKGSVVPGGSVTVLKNAVRMLRPKAVFSVGACSGLTPEKAKLGDIIVSSKLTTPAFKTPVSRDIGKLIRHAADGWIPPLETESDEREVKVHSEGDILSYPQAAGVGWSFGDIIQQYPEAVAIETEGEGVFGAAYDDKMEWVIVKGIAGYGDLSQSSTDEWMYFASAMAASLVANVLCDPVIFQDWPHYNPEKLDQGTTIEGGTNKDKLGGMEGAFDPIEFIDGLRQLYKIREGWLAPFPWCEEFQFHLDNIFTRLKMASRKKQRGTKSDKIVNMSDIFKPHDEHRQPRTVLLEGKPGMGKTTYCKKLAYDWATKKRGEEEDGCFQTFEVVLMLKCRDIKSAKDFWEAIDDQLLPLDVKEDEREKIFEFVRQNQSKVLLILDGLDELPTDKLPMFKEFIQGRILPKCHIVATARHEVGIKVRECCDTLLEVEGFTEEDARDFIFKYFKSMEDLAIKLWSKIRYDKQLRDLTANPLNTALLCLLCDDFKGIFPESRTELFLEIVECVLRRYRTKKGLPESQQDLTEVYKAELKQLGSIALNGLHNDNMYFQDSDFQNPESGEVPGFGFLSVQPGSSKRRPSLCYGFLHKNFQELFAAFYICCQLLDGEISPDSLTADRRYFDKLKQVLQFTCGLLAMQCKETAAALMKSITSQVNNGTSRDFVVVLECINESKRKENDLHEELARVVGSLLDLQRLDVSGYFSEDGHVATLAEVIKTNSTLTKLNLSDNGIGGDGVAALAEVIKTNSTLTKLNLSGNRIGGDGVAAMAEAIKTNTTLTKLNLSGNRIGVEGIAALAEAIKTNSTLSEVNLFGNSIAADNLAALAEAIKTNSTLTVLNVFGSGIGDDGVVALADAIKTNSTLTVLNISCSDINDDGVVALADAIKTNSTLTKLNFSGSYINDGVVALSDAIKTNSTLTVLNISGSDINYDGVVALADPIKTNSTLTVLNFSCSYIKYDAVVALADAIKTNSTLTVLNFSGSDLNYDGVVALADAIKTNSTLTALNFSGCCIYDDGVVALADAIKTNSTLTELNCSGSDINDDGVVALADAIKTNSTLTELNCSCSYINYDGIVALADAIETNSTFAELNCSVSYINYDGVVALADAIKTNSTLTVLNFSGIYIYHNGLVALADTIKTNSTLTELNCSGSDINDDGVVALADAIKTNSTLTELNCSGSDINYDGVLALADAIKTNSTLTVLNFSRSYIYDNGVVALADAIKTNSTLTELNCSGSDINDNGVVALADAIKTNSTLSDLNFSGSHTNDDGVTALADAIKTNSTLTELNCSGSDINDNGVVALADAIKTNSTLTVLNFSGSYINDNGFVALADAIKTNSTLTVLNFSGSYIFDNGVVALADAIKTHSTLAELNCSGSYINYDGVTALADAIKTNSSLTVLNFSGSYIFDDGVTALADAIKTNSSLTVLNFSCSYIFDDGVVALADAIKTNSSLTVLNFSGSYIFDDGVTALADAIKTNSSLTVLNFSNSFIFNDGAAALAEAIKTD